MVSVCLPSDALLQHLPSYLGFSYLGHGVSLHGCSSKVQPLLLSLDEAHLLTTALPDLQHGIAPLGPPAPVQPWLLECGVALPGCRPWPWAWGCGVAPPGRCPWPQEWCCSSWPLPLTSDVGSKPLKCPSNADLLRYFYYTPHISDSPSSVQFSCSVMSNSLRPCWGPE